MSCKQKAHCLNFDLIRSITSLQLYDSESGYRTPEKLRIFLSAIGKHQPFRILTTGNNDCLRRSPGNRCQVGKSVPNGNAKPRQGEGERPRRHGAGILRQEWIICRRGVPATPGALQGKRTAAGCAGDSHTSEPLRSRISKTIDFILEDTQALQHFGINAVQTI